MTTNAAFVLASVGVVGGLFLLSRFPSLRRPKTVTLDDSGSAAMEMVIVLPMFLTTVMMVVQCTHLMFATLLLEHAAFCISRSASVQVPHNLDGEPYNTIWPAQSSHKLNRLNALANTLMAPTNRRYTGFGTGYLPSWNLDVNEFLASSFVPDPEELYGAPTVVSDLFLRWGSGIAAQSSDLVKWGLNLAVARVEIRTTDEPLNEAYGERTRTFSDTAALVVTVIYEYPLDVPAAGNILGPLIGYVPDFGPDWLSRWFALMTGVKHRVDISSTYTVVNWGQTEAPATP